MARYVDLGEEPIAGNSGAPLDPEQAARAAALAALAEPIDIPSPSSEGEAAQALGDAARAQGMPETWAGRDATAGLGPADTLAPRDGGSATMPDAPTAPRLTLGPSGPQLYDPRQGHAAPTISRAGSPASAAEAPAVDAAMRRPEAPTAPPPTTAPTMPQAGTKEGGPDRGEGALQRELRAAQEARARRMIGNAFGSFVEIAGSLATGVPVQPGTPTQAGPGEDEARIMREHRLAAAEKDRAGREEQLATSRAEREAMLEDRDFALRERALGIQEQRATRTEQPSELEGARAAQIREMMARHEREMSPDSPESAAARGEFLAIVDTLPPQMRERTMQALGGRIESMSATELRAPIARLTRYVERGTGGGGGGGGTGQNIQTLRQSMIARGEDPARVNAMTRAELVRASGAEDATQGREIIAGVTTDMDLDPVLQRQAAASLVDARRAWGAFDTLERLYRDRGAAAVIDPTVLAEIQGPMMALRGYAARMQGSGIINPSEMPAINAALPDPTNLRGQTLGTVMSSLRGWRGLIEQNARGELSAYGVDGESWSRARQYITTGAARSQAARAREAQPTEETVRVRRRSDGRTGTMPRSRVTDAYEVIDGP